MPNPAGERRHSHAVRGLPALIAGLALLFPGSGRAHEHAPAATAMSNPVHANCPAVSLMRVERDLEGGGWALSPLGLARARGAELDLAMNHSSIGLVTEELPGGGYFMDLQGRFQSYSLARLDPQGALSLGCDDNPLSLFHWLSENPVTVDVFGRPLR